MTRGHTGDHMADAGTTYTVHLEVRPIEACPPETLEERSIDVMEALDEHTSDAVLGVAVSARFNPPALEIEIDVAAGSVAEVHKVLAGLFEVLERHAGLTADDSSSSTHRSRPERELVPA